jgi:hypothetical protein
VIFDTGGEPVLLPLDEVLTDDEIRLFTVIGEADVGFSAARMNGEVIARRVTQIEVK